MKLETLQGIVRFLVRHLTHTEVLGKEHVPQQGGLLVVTNHNSRLDTPLLFTMVGRDDLTALVADKYKKYLVFRWILDIAHVVWLDRDRADFAALRAGIDYLRQGGALGIAPEGTRSPNGALQEGKSGMVLLADRAGVPILPVGIAGTDTGMHQLMRLRRPHITLNIGPTFTLPPLDRNDREGWLARSTDEIMTRLAAQLPPQYRGMYAGHPRLAELLAQKQTIAQP